MFGWEGRAQTRRKLKDVSGAKGRNKNWVMYGRITRRGRLVWKCKGREAGKINERECWGDGGERLGKQSKFRGVGRWRWRWRESYKSGYLSGAKPTAARRPKRGWGIQSIHILSQQSARSCTRVCVCICWANEKHRLLYTQGAKESG